MVARRATQLKKRIGDAPGKPEKTTVSARFPRKLEFLFRPRRYKIAYGGRGSAKSWSVARALLVLGAQKPLRILCGREIQESIEQSVHKLLSDQVEALGLSHFYDVQKTVIRSKVIYDGNGIPLGQTEFTFHGLKHNVNNIKSAEGTDICWVEEAQTVSTDSWDKLVPTIRKDGSEIWVTFNPELDTDPTYKRFVLDPPSNSFVVKVNHNDNPWFPEVLEQEMADLKRKDYDSYLTVYEGHCRQSLKGAVYAAEIRKATENNQIIKVPYDMTKSVHVFCDLGWSDSTTVWYVQKVGMEYRILLTYQNQHQPWAHYLQHMQASGYLIDRVWLPHDGAAKQLGTGKSIQELTKEAGHKTRIVPNLSIIDGINAARTIFPNCYFDTVGCADGLQSLRRYVWDRSPQGNATKTPKHDENSHHADAFRYFAVGFSEPIPMDEKNETVIKRLKRSVEVNIPMPHSTGWMS